MDRLGLNADERSFQHEVRSFLAGALTPDLRLAGRRGSGIFSDFAPAMRWHRILAARGWSVPHWPREWGGTGWTPMQHFIFQRELLEADAPRGGTQSTRMVAPVLMKFGTPEQKARWLPAIRSGEDYWAQGYSEPGSGSDLASLQCKAVRDGDHYVINGTKIWTTHAQFANRIFCLVRTSSAGKPQQGISFLCFDLQLPGITIRPIISISGDHELNQVFFDDVRVPLTALVGEEDQGWTVAKYLLSHERSHSWTPMLRARMRRLHSEARSAFAAAGAAAQDEAHDFALQLAELDCTLDALEAMELFALRDEAAGRHDPVRPSVGKVLGSEARQRLTELGVALAAQYGAPRVAMESCADTDLPVPEDAVFALSAYLNDRAASIYAGTNEVQRNLVAAHLLQHGIARGAAEPTTAEDPNAEALAMLQDSLARYLANHHPLEPRLHPRASGVAEAAPRPPWWPALGAQLDALGAAWPEHLGGIGAGMAAHVALLPTLGASLAAEPYLSTVVLAAGALLHGSRPRAPALLQGVRTGKTLLAWAHAEPDARHARDAVHSRLQATPQGWLLDARKSVVAAGPWADTFLVSARMASGPHADALALVCVDRHSPGLTLRPYPTLDGSAAAELRCQQVALPADALVIEPEHAAEVIAAVLDDATLGLCAEALGVLQRLLADSLDYARQRKQFGVPIASFQALQHRLADMHMQLALARALVQQTSARWTHLVGDERARAASAAKVVTARACKAVGQGAVQIHGGMGMTEELAVGHFMRRATLIEQQLGSPLWHLRRRATLDAQRPLDWPPSAP